MKIYKMTIKDSVAIGFKTKSLNDFTPIAETDKEIDISQVLRIDGRLYSVWMKRGDNSYAYVEEIDLSKSEDELYREDEIICPHCKNVVSDSYEYPDYDAHFKCGCCGSIFSYERIVDVTYDMILVKKGEVLEVNE